MKEMFTTKHNEYDLNESWAMHNVSTDACSNHMLYTKMMMMLTIGADLYHWQIVINHVIVDAICSLVPPAFPIFHPLQYMTMNDQYLGKPSYTFNLFTRCYIQPSQLCLWVFYILLLEFIFSLNLFRRIRYVTA